MVDKREFTPEVGTRFKTIRERLGMPTQARLATLSRSYAAEISTLERGYQPGKPTLRRVLIQFITQSGLANEAGAKDMVERMPWQKILGLVERKLDHRNAAASPEATTSDETDVSPTDQASTSNTGEIGSIDDMIDAVAEEVDSQQAAAAINAENTDEGDQTEPLSDENAEETEAVDTEAVNAEDVEEAGQTEDAEETGETEVSNDLLAGAGEFIPPRFERFESSPDIEAAQSAPLTPEVITEPVALLLDTQPTAVTNESVEFAEAIAQQAAEATGTGKTTVTPPASPVEYALFAAERAQDAISTLQLLVPYLRSVPDLLAPPPLDANLATLKAFLDTVDEEDRERVVAFMVAVGAEFIKRR